MEIFTDFRGTRCVFGVQDHRECFRSSGVSGRKMCCGAPETLRSEEGFEAGAPEKRNMLWCPENFAEWGISRKITCRYPKRQ